MALHSLVLQTIDIGSEKNFARRCSYFPFPYLQSPVRYAALSRRSRYCSIDSSQLYDLKLYKPSGDDTVFLYRKGKIARSSWVQ